MIAKSDWPWFLLCVSVLILWLGHSSSSSGRRENTPSLDSFHISLFHIIFYFTKVFFHSPSFYHSLASIYSFISYIAVFFSPSSSYRVISDFANSAWNQMSRNKTSVEWRVVGGRTLLYQLASDSHLRHIPYWISPCFPNCARITFLYLIKYLKIVECPPIIYQEMYNCKIGFFSPFTD